MTTKVQQWGNSLAVRIPKSFAKDIQLTKGMEIDLSIANGRLVIDPTPKPRYTLSGLLKKITKSNLHPETDWGLPIGKEVW